MPSVNQCQGVMHNQLGSINCFHLTLLLFRVHLYMCRCALVAHRWIHLHYPHWLRLMCPSSLGSLQWGPSLTGQRWMFDWVVLMSQRRSALQRWYADYVFASSGFTPLPSVSLQWYWSTFNAQTNSSLIIPVFSPPFSSFIASLVSQPNPPRRKKSKRMKWAGERILFAQYIKKGVHFCQKKQ